MAEEPKGKSITDILPSSIQNDSETPDNNLASEIIKHPVQSNSLSQPSGADQQTDQVGTIDDMGSEAVKPSAEVSRRGNDLDPASTSPINAGEPTIVVAQNTSDDTEPKEIVEDRPKSDDPYEPIDSLPINDIKTAEITDEMQGPKIYDTKEYFVPIKDTTHSHGGTGIFIAGVVSAVIVLAIIAFIAMAKY